MAKPLYRGEHPVIRAALKPYVDAGECECAELICLESSRWIQPGTPWDLAHDRATGGYLGPAHRGCNRSEGARYRELLHGRWRGRPQSRPATSSTWSSREW